MKNKISTPEVLSAGLDRSIEEDLVEEVLIISKRPDGTVDVAWSESTHLQLLGLCETAKARILQDMWVDD